jgi:hypothetical protein
MVTVWTLHYYAGIPFIGQNLAAEKYNTAKEI